jgi:ABC-type multidrug transport system fused ATPase/permease subunit
VQFAYTVGSHVIKDFSLEVAAGQTIALVGPTGAGKTTIINLLTRFYEVQGGCISIDGKDIRKFRKADLRRNLGLVLQDTFLFADSVLSPIDSAPSVMPTKWLSSTTARSSSRGATSNCSTCMGSTTISP